MKNPEFKKRMKAFGRSSGRDFDFQPSPPKAVEDACGDGSVTAGRCVDWINGRRIVIHKSMQHGWPVLSG